jgi:Zeta toxin
MSNLRPLADNIVAKAFVEEVLGFTGQKAIDKATTTIMKAEIFFATMKLKPTLKFKEYRSTTHSDDAARRILRERIARELIEKVRLKEDDKIKMGHGGALPQADVSKARQAFIVTGLPASGKSGIAAKIAEEHGAVILDSDYAKRKFPEFKQDYGAHVLHEESKLVIKGDPDDPDALCLELFCLEEGCNIVIPKIGDDVPDLCRLAAYYREQGYTVHLTLVSLDCQQATIRAYHRFIKSKRYVPLSLIFDVYSNNPTRVYSRLQRAYACLFASFGEVSTESKPTRLVRAEAGNPAELFA